MSLTVLVLVLSAGAGEQVGLVHEAGGVQVFEAQEQQQDRGDELSGHCLQIRGPSGQLHQDAQADDAHLTVVESGDTKEEDNTENF